MASFRRFRAMRNALVHCDAGTLEPLVSDVQALYAYVKQAVAGIEGATVVHKAYGI